MGPSRHRVVLLVATATASTALLFCGSESGDVFAPEGADDAGAGGRVERGANPPTDADTRPDSGGASGADADDPTKRKRMFFTSAIFDGDLKKAGNGANGLEGADKLCTREALAAELGGKWTVFLSGRVGGVVVHAPSRLSEGPWYDVTRTRLLFESKDAMYARPKNLLRDEKGRTDERALVPVWTGTRLDAFDVPSCETVDGGDSWVTTAGRGRAGNAGTPFPEQWQTSQFPTDGSPCGEGFEHLYCFEQ